VTVRTPPRIDLTTAEYRQLQRWMRAGTTPQRLARRARLILGCAAGCGSRRLAQQERMSRTTVRRWIARFVVDRCTGLKDRPRRGRPTCIRPVTRALTVALACERPRERNVPLSRYSLAEIAAEVAAVSAGEHNPSRSSVWRLPRHDALRPWRYKCWTFPRDPHFLELAGPVLDLYACTWQGQPLWADEYVLSADEKTSIQVRRRRHATLRPVRSRPRVSSTNTSALARCSIWPRGTCIALRFSAAANRVPARQRSDVWSIR
jgi:transposase